MTKQRKSHHISGRDFERIILGDHETLSFEIRLNSSFDACFANAVMAWPKGHDPDHPTDDWLIAIRDGVSHALGLPVSLYNCKDLPIDILHSTDLLIVSWQTRSFITVDLTLDEAGDSKADVKFLYRHYKRTKEIDRFCDLVAIFLKENQNRITPEMMALVDKKILPKGN
jgi:hypothetical protein